jgi:hypothetical protein
MDSMELGKKVWFFPDGDIPEPGDGEMKGHESLVILNPNKQDAEITITVYFTDQEAVTLNAGIVAVEKVRCIRTNEPIDGFQIPFGQYALKVEGSVGIITQIGRMDVTQPNLAYYTTMGY